MSAKSGKVNTIRLPKEMQKAVEAIAESNHLSTSDVIRLCLMQVLPVIEKEGMTLHTGNTT